MNHAPSGRGTSRRLGVGEPSPGARETDMKRPFLRAVPGGVELAVKLQPRASRNEIGGALGAELKIKVTAPPVDSAANEALVELLAETFNLPRGSVQLARGHTSRHKVVFLANVSIEDVAKQIAQNPTS